MPLIGFLQTASSGATAHMGAAIHRGLKEAGYVEGQNVEIVYRYADGQYDRLPTLVADLVRRQVALIGAFGPPAMLTPFCGGGAVPSDTEPASSGELMLKPTARLAIAKSLPRESLAGEAIDRFPTRESKVRKPQLSRPMVNI